MPDRRLRVLHITECFGGGVARAIDLAARATPQIEHHLLWAGDEDPAEIAPGIPAMRLPAGFRRRVSAIRRAVAELDADVVHAHSSWAGVYSRLGDAGAPVVYQPHAFKFSDPALPAPAAAAIRVAERILARRGAGVAVLTDDEARLAAGVGARRVFRLTNAAALQPPAGGAPTGLPVQVLTIGRIAAQKDPAFFAEAVERMRQTEPGIRAVWIGDGDAALTERLRAAGVEVTGWEDAAGLMQRLSIPSVYLHTAKYEGYPLSILDAAAFGTPIVARAIPALDRSGLRLVDDAGAAADAVLALMHDEAALAASRDRSRQLHERHGIDALATGLTDMYAVVGAEGNRTWRA